MAATLDFTSFFTMAFLGAAPFFTAWLLLIRFNIELLDQLNDNNHTDYIIFDGISSDQTNRVKEEGRAPRGWGNHLFTSHWTILSSN